MADAIRLEDRTLALLRGRNYATVATLARDGTIRTVVVWVHADDEGRIVLNSAEGRAWPAMLRRQKRATVTVINQERPYEFASIVGRLARDTHQGADAEIDMLSRKYHGHGYRGHRPGEQRVSFALQPTWVHHYGG